MLRAADAAHYTGAASWTGWELGKQCSKRYAPRGHLGITARCGARALRCNGFGASDANRATGHSPNPDFAGTWAPDLGTHAQPAHLPGPPAARDPIEVPVPRPPERALPVPRIELNTRQVAPAQVPMPLVHIERPVDSTVSAGIEAGNDTGSGAAPSASRVHHEPRLVSAPATAGFYPLASLEYHEQGEVIVSVSIDANNQVTGVGVLRPSAFTRLNAAAVRLAYKTRRSAALLGNTAIAECAPFEVDYIDINATRS